MKALKILGAIVGMIVVAVGVLWFGWLSPPSAEAVCDNVARLTKKEAGVEPGPKERAACMRTATKPPEFGRAVWVTQLKCMRDAASAAELRKCGR